MSQAGVKPIPDTAADGRAALHRFVRLKLQALGLAPEPKGSLTGELDHMASGLLANFREKSRLLRNYRCPVDQRIESFLAQIFEPLGLKEPLRLPGSAFSLDESGMARELSFPEGSDRFESKLLTSYRIRNGVLHNPRSDRRTTQGTFHVADCGLPVPADKIAVPAHVFASLFRHAVRPPQELLLLPYAANAPQRVEVFCSLLIRPIVAPEIPGISPQKTMECRFFAPGSLVSNLDFVESIFGNAGDPVLPENDAGLDVRHWTGHTGCVILAPHLTGLNKKDLGLPHVDQATARQRRDGMCWEKPDELYNGGSAFKIACRSSAGVMVTLIADNYYGYCKKEVKTQISFAANLMGNAEEEHAGGAVAFPSYSLGNEFVQHEKYWNRRTFSDLVRDYAPIMDVSPDGFGVDKLHPNVIYLPEDARTDLHSLLVQWEKDGQTKSIPLLMENVYLTPSGQKVHLSRHPGTGRFRLIVTSAEGVFCHKPCTVSGGGKSEISKSLSDYMIYGPIYVGNLERDLDQVEVILKKDHAVRWKTGKEPHNYAEIPSRPILSLERSLGSVIKLLTPTADYTDEYNHWLASIHSDILALVFLIKRLFKPEWGDDWRRHFSVDIINGDPGHELKMDDRKVGGTYLRVGLLPNGAWRTFKVRQDFFPAVKVQMEDDITASITFPAAWIDSKPYGLTGSSLKLAVNVEQRLFQRPDDAVHPGLDKQTESDLAQKDNFLSNFEPLDARAAREIVERITEFDGYTAPMKQMLSEAARVGVGYVVSSAHPRLVGGKPSKNPRYLQLRSDLAKPLETYVASMSVRLARALPLTTTIVYPVHSVLLGRRNNPPDPEAGIRPLAVFNPIHYQELPELFMDFICSLTGKSPSTTGAGSEGAMTKGPFNALWTTADLNAALVSYALTGLGGFSTAAGYVGPNCRVDHDISLLIPELWCRLHPHERDPVSLIANGHLEKLQDFLYKDGVVPASRLGYRITAKFMRTFLGRIFDNPARIFDQAMLKPESQGMDIYVDGIMNIVETQQRVAQGYFEDGSVEAACPPLKALLHIMAHGNYEGKDVHHPDIRGMFTRDYLISSQWYHDRLNTKQQRDIALWNKHVKYLQAFIDEMRSEDSAAYLDIQARLQEARTELARVSDMEYVKHLVGTIGADPSL
jgi:phosphoenolpyruvate carboxykinase (diphosphate)